MERFFGGNPALVLVRLAILSLDRRRGARRARLQPARAHRQPAAARPAHLRMGFTAIEKAARYFLLGAVIVFPVWLVMRLLKVVGRGSTEVLDPARATARPSFGLKESPGLSPAACPAQRRPGAPSAYLQAVAELLGAQSHAPG